MLKQMIVKQWLGAFMFLELRQASKMTYVKKVKQSRYRPGVAQRAPGS